jgi:PhnB protein
MRVNPYLHFNGQCEAASKFYEKGLGGKIEAMIPHEGTLAAEYVPAEWRSKIMHACRVVDDQDLMGCDAPPDHFQKPRGFSVSIQIKKPAEAERIFGTLAEEGRLTMPIQETFWAERFGMVVDRFGIPRMVNGEKAA